MYLPAFPAMAADLGADATGVQFTLTAFLLGAGIGQLFFGPLSDRVGRRLPLVIGTAVCVAAGLATCWAPNVAVLTVARLVQGLSGSSGMVLSRAIISDVAQGREAARAFNLTSVVLGIAPVAAPLVGSLLAAAIGWRGLLAIVAGIGVVTLAAVVLVVPETHAVEAVADRPAAPRGGWVSRPYVGYTLTFVLAYAAMMAFISASPFVYQVVIGMGEIAYGVLFGATAGSIAAVTYIAARLVRRVRTARLLRVGVFILLGSAIVLATLVAGHAPPAWLIAPLTVGIAAMGLVLGNAPALALGAVPHSVGLASAWLGASQFVVGAAVSPLVGIAGDHSTVPLAAVFGTAALLAAAASLYGARHAGQSRPTA
jgi:DHA1 family bicyclomycin/chloramphenicol resistance-like MFS transporter